MCAFDFTSRRFLAIAQAPKGAGRVKATGATATRETAVFVNHFNSELILWVACLGNLLSCFMF